MSHCPSKVNNEQKHCHGFYILQLSSKLIKAHKHCCGLLNPSKNNEKCITTGC
jgi:hypothetical protein